MKNISSKFLAVLLLVAGLPLIVSSLINIDSTRNSLVEESLTTLDAIADYRARQIEDYLDFQEDLIRLAARSPLVVQAFERLPDALAEGGDSDAYRRLDRALREYFEYFADTDRFEDVYLVSADGDVLFSLRRKADFGSNLLSGPYVDSPLADSFQLALTLFGANFTGYHPYAPSDDAYSAFYSVPIFARGYPIGTVSAQMKSDALYAFSDDFTGLYQTGEVRKRPIGEEDIEIILALVEETRPDIDVKGATILRIRR